MPVLSLFRPGRSMNPMTFLATILVVGGLVYMARDRDRLRRPPGGPADGAPPCAVGEDCASPAQENPSSTRPPVLDAESTCPGTGYLCAELDHTDHILVQHWRDFEGIVVVHVPPPSFEDEADARRLQQAAAAGIRQWDGQPFRILVDERGTRQPSFSVEWTPTLGGSRIGVAHTEWSRPKGLVVVSLQLSTRSPLNGQRVLDPRQVLLTAAHEMGHALGLPHSDSDRDVMYPTNTATKLSARDYRTMEALYALEDGTEIVRR